MEQIAMLEEALRAAKEERARREEEAKLAEMMKNLPPPPPLATQTNLNYDRDRVADGRLSALPLPRMPSAVVRRAHFAPNPLKDVEPNHVLNAPSPFFEPHGDAEALEIVSAEPDGPGSLTRKEAQRLLGGAKLIEKEFERTRSEESIQTEIAAATKTGSKELLTGDDIDLKTELNHKEIIAASRLLFISERYEMPVFTHFVTNYLRLKVSKDRKGRQEYIQGLHAEEKKEQGRDLSPLGALLNTITGR